MTRRLTRLAATAGTTRGPTPAAASSRVPPSGAASGAPPGVAPPGAPPYRAVAAGDAIVMDLLAGACAAGASLPTALLAVGASVPTSSGRPLVRAGTALGLGATWDEAWPDGGPVARALRAGWEDGSAPGPALRAAADAVRRDRHARALEAASRLGVRLVLPLGLCHLPAFVLLGVAPVLVSMAGGAVLG